MISSLAGILKQVDADRAFIQNGALEFEVLVPASDAPELRGGVGQEIKLFTIFDLEGDPSRGGLSPRLIGFLRIEDKRFFELFTTVKGIGPKRALRALTEPTARIAQAIEARDAKFLVSLPEIGKRTAEQIIAELAGKLQRFAGGAIPEKSAASHRPSAEEDAIAGAMALGLQRIDAERLLDRAKATVKQQSTDALLREMLRQR